MISENLSDLQDSFLDAYKQGDISKANLTDKDFTDLVQKYHNGDINFTEYSIEFYKRAITLSIPHPSTYEFASTL